jgi:uncharacterized protein (DUF362 family)/ferredoxin
LEPALTRLLAPLGGMEALVRPGQRVLIKPNLLAARPPESQVATHPALVLAVGKLVLGAGGIPVIADSPALETLARVARKTGLAQVAAQLGAELVELSDPIPAPATSDARFKGLALARLALETPVVINLPKLKTHSQMLLTLAVKNLFGTVVGLRKSEWHLTAGLDRLAMADLLLDIAGAVRPGLSILDGVWGMEGHGPNHGTPRHLGILAAGPDPLALDLHVARLLGVRHEEFPLAQAALRRGLLTAERLTPLLHGDPLPLPLVTDWELPGLRAVGFLPSWLENMASRHLVSRPTPRPRACQGCGQCLAICPASCLTLEGRRLSFDYDRCIRCYCCQEVCPHDAIGFHHGLLARTLHRLGR